MGDEIRNPRRVIPLAILISGTVLVIGYIAGTASLLVALPGDAVSGPDGFVNGIRALSTRMGVGWLLAPMALLVGLNGIGGTATFLSSTSRLPFVAGIDCYLPQAFGKIHPRFKTPWVAIGVYGLAGACMALLGQAGTTVRGAYDVLVSMAVLTEFLPFLFMFAALIAVQSRPIEREVRRIPGGRPVAIVLGSIGLMSTALTIVLSTIPAGDDPNPALAVMKILGSTAILIGSGAAVFALARLRQRKNGAA
jgi:amino acid transporter